MGLTAECRAADDVVPAAVTARIETLLQAIGVSSVVPQPFADPRALWALATKDKKVQNGRVPMVVPVAIGDGRVVELTPARLARAFA